MKSFHFRLQKVLDWQREQCELTEHAIQQLAAALEQTNAMLAKLKASRVMAEQEVLRAKVVAARDLAALAAYRTRLKRQEDSLRHTCRQYEQRLAEERQRWTEQRRRHRLLDKLKSRRQQEHAYEMDRELERFASENYLAQWQLRRGGR